MRRIADRQEGVITTRQLKAAGLSDAKITRWTEEGHLSRRHRTIYTVGLDSRAAHAMPARMEEDRRRDLLLRAAGFDVWRYTRRQLDDSPSLVAAELKARDLARRR